MREKYSCDLSELKLHSSKKGFSIVELGDAIGKSQAALYQVIKRNNVDLDTLLKICNTLDISPLTFIKGIDETGRDTTYTEELEEKLAETMELVHVMKMVVKQGAERVEELKERIKKLEGK